MMGEEREVRIMFDPFASLRSWIGIMLDVVDTLVAAFLTPVFGLLGIPIPSVTDLILSGLA